MPENWGGSELSGCVSIFTCTVPRMTHASDAQTSCEPFGKDPGESHFRCTGSDVCSFVIER
jgi:hypothetical protein